MPGFYPKKWFVVPHDEYPAATSLALGQLVGSVDAISHSLNRTTLIAPPPSDIQETLQINSDITVFKDNALHASLNVSSPFAPVSAEAGGGVDWHNTLKFKADVVLTQVFRPTDDYARANFNASRKETEMVNHLKRLWDTKVFMITARKVGKAITISRDEADGFEQKAKIGFNVQQAVTVEASLGMNWKEGLKIGSLTEQPCVFAVQLKRVLYHSNPMKPVTTEDYVKNAVMGKDDERKEEEEEDMELVFAGVSEEGPRVDQFDYDTVVKPGLDGEDEFLVQAED